MNYSLYRQTFIDEETGCCVDNYRVSIRRRWNYENNVAAIVTYISSGNYFYYIL